MKIPQPGKYIRNDGEEFEVIGMAKDVSTGMKCVVYRDIKGDMLVCPVAKWTGYSPLENVSTDDYIPAPEPPPVDISFAPMPVWESDIPRPAAVQM